METVGTAQTLIETGQGCSKAEDMKVESGHPCCMRLSMRPMSEFTWDWIVEACGQEIQRLTQFIDQDPKRSHQAQENYRRGFEALILAVGQLREHPQLAGNVPMKSLGTLRWFPRDGYEVDVYYNSQKLRYEVTIHQRDATSPSGLSAVEQVNVHLSKLPKTVVALIEKTRQMPLA